MALSPWVKKPNQCCAKCTKRPTLPGCHLAYGCPCHLGYKPPPPPEAPLAVHACAAEHCLECLP